MRWITKTPLKKKEEILINFYLLKKKKSETNKLVKYWFSFKLMTLYCCKSFFHSEQMNHLACIKCLDNCSAFMYSEEEEEKKQVFCFCK